MRGMGRRPLAQPQRLPYLRLASRFALVDAYSHIKS